MRRTDRLIDLVQILRDGQLHLARDLADSLGVSQRTVYRDMDTLIASGLPVEGARGVGYIMNAPITLPPLNLTLEELEALHLGVAIVGEAAEPELQKAAKSMAAKLDAALPEDRAAPPNGWGFAVYPFGDAANGFVHMPPLRAAIRARQKLRITVADDEQQIIRPLSLDYWGRVWTATAWCEGRKGFAVFRLDQITALDVLPELFVDEPGKTFDDYVKTTG
ncbi:MAG: YafY family protein [Pseudomonadota bacterium]